MKTSYIKPQVIDFAHRHDEPRENLNRHGVDRLRYGFTNSGFGRLFARYYLGDGLGSPAAPTVVSIGFLRADSADDGRAPATGKNKLERDDTAIAALWQAIRSLLLGAPAAASAAHFRAVGTPFQTRVWRELAKLSVGECVTYGGLAARMGLDARSARAVGGAVASNPLSLVIPCHRVVPSAGGYGNYAWGASIKAKLIEWERDIAARK